VLGVARPPHCPRHCLAGSRSLHTHQASRALPTQDSNSSSHGEPALEGTVPLCCVRCMSMSAARRPYLVRTEPLQLADGLLKLNVPGAGFLADIRRMCLCCSRRHRPSPTDTQQGQCPTRRAAQSLRWQGSLLPRQRSSWHPRQPSRFLTLHPWPQRRRRPICLTRDHMLTTPSKTPLSL
jgi:hypothetical protein